MSRLCFVSLVVITTLSSAGYQEISSETASVVELLDRAGEPLEVQVVGRDCRWEVTYPGRDRVFSTADDIAVGNRLHLPSDTAVRLLLRSFDFVYSFALPELKQQEIAVPDMTFTLSLIELTPGRLTLRGGELCGDRRSELSGTIVVQSPAEWHAWLHRVKGGHD